MADRDTDKDLPLASNASTDWLRKLEHHSGRPLEVRSTGIQSGNRGNVKSLSDLRILVTPRGYDDMGSVLSKLSLSYQDSPVDNRTFGELLRKQDVLFINCAGYQPDRETKGAVAEFIHDGGSVFCSDYAFEWLEGVSGDLKFSGKIGFAPQQVNVSLVDLEVRRLAKRNNLSVQFDASGWVFATTLPHAATVLFEGTVSCTDGKTIEKLPLAFRFRHGRGTVCYTSFHNHAQTNEAEEILLSLLALQPIASSAGKTIEQLLAEAPESKSKKLLLKG